MSSLSTTVKRAAADAGFDLVGVAPVAAFRELAVFPDWLARGYAGDMRYMESRDQHGRLKRASLSHVAPWARSVIVGAVNYNSAAPHSTECHDSRRAWISRYAWSREDYHDILLRRLRQVERTLHAVAACETRCYVDTGPVVERVWARYAGIGWIGKNTCLINQQLGSWLFLGVILTSLALTPDLPAADRCGSCTRCLQACPTNAFIGPHQLDARRCISYLTIEKRGLIAEALRTGTGNHVFGCDICQDVCPWNRRAPATAAPEFAPRPELVNPALDWLATLTLNEFRQAFRGSPIKRAKYAGLRRNAAIAMANSGDPAFIPHLEQLAHDADPAVAEAACWALSHLRKSAPQ